MSTTAPKWSTPKRCYCRDEDGRDIGRTCPKLTGRHHGVWGYSTRIPASTKTGTRELRRFGFSTMAKANKAADQAWDVIKLAGDDDATARKIGDMIFEKTARGGELPQAEDVRRRLGLRRDPAKGETFADAWAGFLTVKRKARRESYVKWLEEIGRNWLLPVLADIQLDRVNGEHCALVFSRVDDLNEEIDLAAEQGRAPNVPEDIRKKAQHVGVTTQHGIYRALRAFLNWCWKKARKIPFNPVYMVELEPDVSAEPLTWSPDQAALFLRCHREDRLYWLWRLALLRGFRRGELCGMADADFNAAEGCITVNAALLEIGGRLVWGKPKSKKGERVVDLDAASVKEGKAHQARRKRERLAAGGAWEDSGCMFTTELGDPLRPDWVSRRFKDLADEAGLPRIKFHATRHTAASLALEAGVDIKIVSEQLGHSSTSFTRDRYQHVRRQVARNAAELVVALLPDEDDTDAGTGS
jgi:integrase